MIIETVDQLSPEWFKIKAGLPSASNFSKILSPIGVVSKQAKKYALVLAGELRMGKKVESYQSSAMGFGIETEEEARAYYELHHAEVQEVGMIYYDERKDRSCSPDGLVGDDGGLEIKCVVKLEIHLERLLKAILPTEFIPQIQGSMLITGRKWWDFLSYYPDYPDQLVVRTYRDDAYIAKLDGLLNEFIVDRDRAYDDLCHLPKVSITKPVPLQIPKQITKPAPLPLGMSPPPPEPQTSQTPIRIKRTL